MGRKYYRRLNDDTWFEYDMGESGIVNPGTYYPMPLWLKIFFFVPLGACAAVIIWTIIKVMISGPSVPY